MKWMIVGLDLSAWGPFEAAVEACDWAKRKWPDQDQADDEDENGWTLIGIQPPEQL